MRLSIDTLASKDISSRRFRLNQESQQGEFKMAEQGMASWLQRQFQKQTSGQEYKRQETASVNQGSSPGYYEALRPQRKDYSPRKNVRNDLNSWTM